MEVLMVSFCHRTIIGTSEVSLVGEGVKPLSDLFCGKNIKNGQFYRIWVSILRFTAANSYSGHRYHGCHRNIHEARGNETFSEIYGRFTAITLE